MQLPARKIECKTAMNEVAPVVYANIILAHPNVESAYVFAYQRPLAFQQRIKMTDFEKEIVESALSIRANAGVPFWEAIFIACIKKGRISEAILDAASFHHGAGERSDIKRYALEQGELMTRAVCEGVNIGLSSAVKVDEEELHLPMMDFRCEVSERNTDIAFTVCKRIMPAGFVLLDSGDSYHACGTSLLSAKERIWFLAQALAYAPLVDSRYLAHQLRQSESSIRVSVGGNRHAIPKVLRLFYSD